MPDVIFDVGDVEEDECPSCGSSLVVFGLIEGIRVGCPECLPDEMVAEYAAFEYSKIVPVEVD